MRLGEHLQASFMAGLIDKYRGASKYMNERTNTLQANRVIVLRAKSRKEVINLEAISNQNKTGEENVMKNATHVVVGITYGAEAYCVLSQTLDSQVTDDDKPNTHLVKVKTNLSEIANKLVNALDSDNKSDFQENFTKEDKQHLSRIKCRLFADLQTQTVRECNVAEAYKHCTKLIEQIKTNDNGKMTKSVPITVWLYPLKELFNPAGNRIEYREIDEDIMSRCHCLWSKLEGIIGKAEVIHSTISTKNRKSLSNFIETIVKYQDLLTRNTR